MQVTGIVAEYNPFHMGHQYHIEKAKKETAADGIAVVMSGSFVQRGEPAVFDKWTRAFHALSGGADLVLELPALYALSSAEYFAKGAVETLKSTGIVNTLSFGSESGDIESLTRAAEILKTEPPAFRIVLREKMQAGFSYAAARAAALSAVDTEAGTLLEAPNNILALAYLCALDAGVCAHTVKRQGSGYLETDVDGRFASALALRGKLAKDESIDAFVPYSTEGLRRHGMEEYEELALYALRTADWDKYISVPGNVKKRLQGAEMERLQDVLESAKTKHITMAAIKRAVLQILLQNTLPPETPPAYIRVLGFTERGAEMLKRMKKTAQLPVITRPAAYKEICPLWDLEKRATDIFFLPVHLARQDLKRAPVQYHCKERNK